jgi:hypothetical protein
MGITNLTKDIFYSRKFHLSLVLLFLFSHSSRLLAQCSAPSCHDMVQVSIDVAPATITPGMLLANPSCAPDYSVVLSDKPGNLIGNTIDCSHVGKTLTAKVFHNTNGNWCWGKILVEDKTPPVISCPLTPFSIQCTDTIPYLPRPAWRTGSVPSLTTWPDVNLTDNCDANPTILLLNEVRTLNDNATPAICEDDFTVIRRTYKGVDKYGNASGECQLIIHIIRPFITPAAFPPVNIWPNFSINALVPANVEVECSDADFDKKISADDVTHGTGRNLLKYNTLLCGYQVKWTDMRLSNPEPCQRTYKITRDWVAICWCNGAVLNYQQIVKVVDKTPPVVIRGPISLSANLTGTHPSLCRTDFPIPPAEVSDNCHNFNVTVSTPFGLINGNGGSLPAPIPIGTYIITYVATDGCGNKTELPVTLQVLDDIRPTPVCQEFTIASLRDDGTVTVFASSFDAGSYDNCCLDKIEVRRMDRSESSFGPSVSYSCSDLFNADGSAKRHSVILRAYDCNTPAALTNECMVELRLQDKISPTCDNREINIDCDYYSNVLKESLINKTGESAASVIWGHNYVQSSTAGKGGVCNSDGTITGWDNSQIQDNCTPIRKFVSFQDSIDKCHKGFLRVIWFAEDQAKPAKNESPKCTTQVNVRYRRDILFHESNIRSNSDIVFPRDTTYNNCFTGKNDLDFGKVWVNPARESCELIASSYCDVIYTSQVGDLVGTGACYKVVRTWTVVDWCTFNEELGEYIVNAKPLSRIDGSVLGGGYVGDSTCIVTVPSCIMQWGPNTSLGTRPRSNPAPLNEKYTAAGFGNLNNNNFNCHANSCHLSWQQTIYVIDNDPPDVSCPDTVVVEIGKESDDCKGTFRWQKPVAKDCSPMQLFTYFQTIDLAENHQPYGTFNRQDISNLPLGTYTINYRFVDICNNFKTCQQIVKVVDKKPPVAYCVENLIITLDYEGKAVVNAKDFNFKSFDDCTNNLIFSFSPDTSKTTLTFECRNIGANSIEMWVTDEYGNQDYCLVYLFVQQHFASPCPRPRVALGGKIQNENEKSIVNSEVRLSGFENKVVSTTANGIYEFQNIELGGDYSVTPYNNSNPLNGVTTFDMVLISRHILGIQLLDSPYKLLAADVNKSGSVTTLDIVELRKLILFSVDNFASSKSWRFISKDFIFPNPSNPFATPVPEVKNYNNVEEDHLNADFIAIKVGDVNASASPTGKDLQGRNFEKTYGLLVEDKELKSGETTIIPIRGESADLSGIQFTLQFSPNLFDIVEVIPGILAEENFGYSRLQQGALLASYHSANPIQIDDNRVLFSLKIKAKGNGSLRDILLVNSQFTAAEAYGNNLELMGVALNFNGMTPDNFALLQNYPNPFTSETSIKFYLPTDSFARITISDVSGKIQREINGNYKKGLNSVLVSNLDGEFKGILFCKVETGYSSEIIKMVAFD